jgi:iron complex outermembrane receptor protein
MSCRSVLFASAVTTTITIAAGGAPPVQAAGAGAPAQAQTSTSSGSNSAPTQASLQEVVVTAQRRKQLLRNVPMTIASASGNQLAQLGVTASTGLQRVTSGVEFPFFGGFLSPSIRGVSSNVTVAGGPSNVAFYLDGVYQPDQVAQLMSLPDVEQVQILKGPQGTLYGQNAEGGAIIVDTLAPAFTPTGRLDVSYGNYGDVKTSGFESGPITDSVAQSVSASYETHNGFSRNNITGEQDQGLDDKLFRGKLLAKPADGLSLELIGYYAEHHDSSIFSGTTWKNLGVAAFADPASVQSSGPSEFTTGGSMPFFIKTWGGALKASFDSSIGTVKFTSSYDRLEHLADVDYDYSPLNIAYGAEGEDNHDYIEELDFISNQFMGAEVTAGVFYQDSLDIDNPTTFKISYPVTIWPAPAGPLAYFINEYERASTRSFAAYAEASYDVTTRWVITAGGRYSTETENGYTTCPAADYLNCWAPTETNQVQIKYSPATWSNFSPRATVTYKLTDDSNLYFSYSKGFKSGILDILAPASPGVSPETLAAYEVGYKAALFDRWSIGLSAFHYDYNNLQYSRYNGASYVFANAATSKIDGVDLDTALAVTSDLSVKASLEALPTAKYTSFPNAQVYEPDTTVGGLDSVTVDLSGDRMMRAPRFTGNLAADYRVSTAIGGFEAFGSVYYTSAMRWDPNGLITEPSYALVDAQVAYTPIAAPRFKVALWGTNLTNKYHLQSSLETAYAAGVSYAPPRQYGVKLEYNY